MRGDLTSILDALEQAVEQARSMPMSSSVLVSRAEVLDLIGQLRATLPTQLADADELLATAAEVQARANADAEQVIAAARRRADELVSAEQVVAAAGVRATEIVAEAERIAGQLRREADDYCDRRLADFEIDLGRLLSQVQAGRGKLAGRVGGSPCGLGADPPGRSIGRWSCRSWRGPRPLELGLTLWSARSPWIPVRRTRSTHTSSAADRGRCARCS